MVFNFFSIEQLVFYIFSFLLIFSALMVIILRNPVHALLWLIFSFVVSSVLWMLLQAEFLALVLVFVYVGAVMTLFLFVVMMIPIHIAVLKEKFVRYLPYGILVLALLVSMTLLVVGPRHFYASSALPTYHTTSYSNVNELGVALYTQYVYSFELAAVILLVAIIAAISVGFHGRKSDAKAQRITLQLEANKKNRLRIVKIKEELQ